MSRNEPQFVFPCSIFVRYSEVGESRSSKLDLFTHRQTTPISDQRVTRYQYTVLEHGRWPVLVKKLRLRISENAAFEKLR